MSALESMDPVYDAWRAATNAQNSSGMYRAFRFWRMARHAEGIMGREALTEAAKRAVSFRGLEAD